MTIWLIPIEPLPERYSEQWLRWFPAELARLGKQFVTVVGFQADDKINQGEFLDVVDTNLWKATQLSAFVHMLRGGEVQDGDLVLCLDAWSPAVIQLAYMRDLGRVKFKIAGLMHAGSYDPWDLLGRTPRIVGGWGPPFERALFSALDAVFVATELHCGMLVGAGCDRSKITVTGFPLLDEEWTKHARAWAKRPRRVVFPHRLAPEKAPEDFDAIIAAYNEMFDDGSTVEWVRTKDACSSKEGYYALLGESRVAISTAKQETWGIAMLEAASLGCWPVAPARLSYVELYGTDHLYTTPAGAANLIHRDLKLPAPYLLDPVPGHSAIERMVAVMESL